MASAVLASRNEPHWGESKVHMRQNPNFPPPNKNQQIYDLQQNHPGRFQRQNFPPDAPPSILNEPPSSSQNRNHPNSAVGFGESIKCVKFNISEYTKKELKDLKRRFVSELQQVRALSTHLEARGPSPRGLKRPFPFTGPSMAEKKVLGNMMKRCGTILKKLMTHLHGYIFNEPVDPIKLNLHDYTKIIRNPMDLGTVKSKLTNNMYKTPLDFAADVRLTFDNALLYNPKGHEVAVLAEILLKQFNESFEPAYTKFESDLKKLGSSIVVPVGISDDEKETEEGPRFARVLPSSPDRMRTVTPDRVMHKPAFRGGNLSQQQSSRKVLLPPPLVLPEAVMPPPVVSGGRGRPWSGKQAKPKARDVNKRDMSNAEKEKLGEDLQNLPLDKQDQIVQIVKKRNAGEYEEGDEIEIDIEAMDTETLWELDRFVGNYKKMLAKMRRRQSLSGGNGNQQHYPAMEGNKSPMAVEMPEVKNRKAENECMEEDVDIGEDIPTSNFPPVEIEKDDAGYASDNKPGASSGSSSSDNDSSSDSEARLWRNDRKLVGLVVVVVWVLS
ncbi:hypothetical protein MKW94_016717 [Papaver nudicaule]|uniref:Uncharacterized protein n=1 Tax=Papaver nudicaule TaxID=74823 RepID=A0AA41V119_PAPNU|nr:hypothetical protein [Papaver nudicaule]